MLCSLGRLADEVRAMPETVNQSVATLRSTVGKSEAATEENRRAAERVQKLGGEVQTTVGNVTAAIYITMAKATEDIE